MPVFLLPFQTGDTSHRKFECINVVNPRYLLAIIDFVVLLILGVGLTLAVNTLNVLVIQIPGAFNLQIR